MRLPLPTNTLPLLFLPQRYEKFLKLKTLRQKVVVFICCRFRFCRG